MAFGLWKAEPELCSSYLLGFLPTCFVLFPPNFGIDSPIDCPPDLIESVDADSIPPTSNSHKDATLFHNHDRLEGYSTNQCVRRGSGRGNERDDVQPLGMA